jgi:hypothetical protein
MWKRPFMTWYGNYADNECKTVLGQCKAQGREPELELEMEELFETKTECIATKAKRRGSAPYYEKAPLRAHWFAEKAPRHDIPLAKVPTLSPRRNPTTTNFTQAFFFLYYSVAHISTYLTRRTKR